MLLLYFMLEYYESEHWMGGGGSDISSGYEVMLPLRQFMVNTRLDFLRCIFLNVFESELLGD